MTEQTSGKIGAQPELVIQDKPEPHTFPDTLGIVSFSPYWQINGGFRGITNHVLVRMHHAQHGTIDIALEIENAAEFGSAMVDVVRKLKARDTLAGQKVAGTG
jgi:hypothetical protein